MDTSWQGTGGRRTVGAAVLLVLLVLLVAAIYWPVAGFGFINYDDGPYVYGNPFVLDGLTATDIRWAFATRQAGMWIPLTWLSLMADASLWSGWAGGYHVTNVVLHALSALLLFLLLRRLLGTVAAPLLAAALFAVHPLHVESVAWVAERKDVLAQVLFLLFLHAWLGHRRRPAAGRLAAALLLLALSLMAKPTAATAPALLLVLDWWPLGRLHGGGWRRLGALAREKLPAAGVGLGFGVAAVLWQRQSGAMVSLDSYTPLGRVGNAAVTLTQTLGRALFPLDLSPFYPPPARGIFPLAAAVAAVLTLVVLAAAALLLRRSQPWLAAGAAWYLLAFAPLSGAFQSGNQVTADRFAYLPLLLPHAAAALLLVRGAAAQRRPARAAALALIPILLALAANRQVRYWQDGISLFGRAVAVSPDNGLTHNFLGLALAASGRMEEAVAEYKAAVQLNPGLTEAFRNLGGLLGALGRPDEGEVYLRRAMEHGRDAAGTRTDLGDLLLNAGRLEEAEREYEAALADGPGAAAPLRGLAALRLTQGRLAESRDLAAAAARLDPADARAWYVLGTSVARLGDPATGERHLRRALLLRPEFADAGYNLALTLLDQGHREEAKVLLEDLIRRHPEDAGIGDLRDSLRAPGPTPAPPLR